MTHPGSDSRPRRGGPPVFELSLFGERFRFVSERAGFLEKCLRLHYGDMIVRRTAGASRGDAARLDFIDAISSASEHTEGMEIAVALPGAPDGAVMRCSGAGRRCRVLLPPGPVENPEALFFSAITTFIFHVLKSRSILFFHASGVSLHGKGILFCGGNVSGKSTLMREMLARGAEYMSDDSAAMLMDEGPRLLRNHELLNAADICEERMGKLYARGFGSTHGGLFLSPPGGSLRTPVKFVFFPSFVQDMPEFFSLSARGVLVNLLRVCKTPLAPVDYEWFFQCCEDIATTATGYEIKIRKGGDLPVAKLMEICETI